MNRTIENIRSALNRTGHTAYSSNGFYIISNKEGIERVSAAFHSHGTVPYYKDVIKDLQKQVAELKDEVENLNWASMGEDL